MPFCKSIVIQALEVWHKNCTEKAEGGKVMSVNTEHLRKTLVLVSVSVSLYYLIWRLGTLNEEAMIFSLIVYGAEVYGFVASLMFFYMVWSFPVRTPKGPPKGLKVDVFIPTYNESIDILRKTIQGALNIRYPHKTWVLDDGNRPEVKRLCEELGCGYISREKNTYWKAGNLNNALKYTDGDFIAVFDADHVPEPDFLDKTLGYFTDEKVAFVQTPQDFYNVDSYGHRISKGRLWYEEALFYKIIMRGKDRINSAFFCGSCAVIRRRALEDIGGFATGTVTEDLHTSIRLHAKGWKSIYHPETLAYGVAPSTYDPYKTQRERWGKGAIQILFSKDSPFIIKGLTFPQRISYIASMTTYFDGFQKAIFYIAPAVVLFTGIFPISVSLKEFLPIFLPHLFFSLWAFNEMARGHGKLLFLEQYNMARFFSFMKSVLGMLRGVSFKFNVTNKEQSSNVPLRGLIPQILVLSVSLFGIIYALINFSNLNNKNLYIANMFWAFINTSFAFLCLLWTLRKKHRRKRYRFPANIPAIVRLNGVNTAVTVNDLHAEGAAILFHIPLRQGENITISLNIGDEKLELSGRILYFSRMDKSGVFRYGVRFERVSDKDISKITIFNFRFLIKRYMEEYNKPDSTVFSGLTRLLERGLYKKRSKRFKAHIPCFVINDGKDIPCTTEDVSSKGMRILTYEPLCYEYITVNLGNKRVISGRIIWSKELSFYGIRAYRYGVSFVESKIYEFKSEDVSEVEEQELILESS